MRDVCGEQHRRSAWKACHCKCMHCTVEALFGRLLLSLPKTLEHENVTLGPRTQARQQDEAGAQLAAEKKALVETVRRQAQSVARLDAFRRNLLATLQTSPDVRPRPAQRAL